jgi:hypothetical protein
MSNIIDEKIEALQKELAIVEMDVLTNYTLADAIREGSTVTSQAHGWGDGNTACTLSAAYLAARARGYA